MRLNAEYVNHLLELDLVAAGWDQSMEFYPGQVPSQVAKMSLAKSFLKKFHDDETDSERDAKALELFLACNESCRLRDYGLITRDTFQELVVGEMKSIIYDFFNPPQGFVPVAKVDDFTLFRDREPFLLNLTDIAARFGFGKGSNIGSPGTDHYSKFCNSRMSATDPALLVLYRHAISGDGLLHEIETFRGHHYKSDVVAGNRLSFVPKSAKISRTICTEPTLNMLFQKGIGTLMEERLIEMFNINFSTQPSINSSMALRGSLTGEFGTIDLSSASDTISTSVVRELLPPEPFNWLMRTRSPRTILPDGSEVELHMISSMGNAFTFPLQTLIFAALTVAVYKVLDIRVQRHGKNRNFSVFGDDIIVDARAYNSVVSCLELLGFTVNHSKSFNEGPFRESCGTDYYDGVNVRGVYLEKLKTPGDFYSAINRLNRWSAYHRTCLPGAVEYLLEHVKKLYVPFDESDDAGIKVPLRYISNRFKRDRNGAIKYVALVNVPRRAPVPTAEQLSEDPCGALARVRRYLPHFRYCPAGILASLLAGWLRTRPHVDPFGFIGLRVTKPRSELRRRVCPSWDSSIPAYVEKRAFRDIWQFVTEVTLPVDGR